MVDTRLGLPGGEVVLETKSEKRERRRREKEEERERRADEKAKEKEAREPAYRRIAGMFPGPKSER